MTDNRAQALQQCEAAVTTLDTEVAQLEQDERSARKALASLEKEVSSGAATVSDIRGTLSVRRLARDIAGIQDEIDKVDIEKVREERRRMDEECRAERQEELSLQSKVRFCYHLVFISVTSDGILGCLHRWGDRSYGGAASERPEGLGQPRIQEHQQEICEAPHHVQGAPTTFRSSR